MAKFDGQIDKIKAAFLAFFKNPDLFGNEPNLISLLAEDYKLCSETTGVDPKTISKRLVDRYEAIFSDPAFDTINRETMQERLDTLQERLDTFPVQLKNDDAICACDSASQAMKNMLLVRTNQKALEENKTTTDEDALSVSRSSFVTVDLEQSEIKEQPPKQPFFQRIVQKFFKSQSKQYNALPKNDEPSASKQTLLTRFMNSWNAGVKYLASLFPSKQNAPENQVKTSIIVNNDTTQSNGAHGSTALLSELFNKKITKVTEHLQSAKSEHDRIFEEMNIIDNTLKQHENHPDYKSQHTQYQLDLDALLKTKQVTDVDRRYNVPTPQTPGP